MGYEVHITRKDTWFDNNPGKEITMAEWKEIVANDPDMRLDNYAEATTTSGDTISVVSEGLSVWTKYSGNGVDSNYAWFSHSHGCIVVKNPDDEIMRKMFAIANTCNAKLQGDEGEVYELTPNYEIRFKFMEEGSIKEIGSKKPWWKFW